MTIILDRPKSTVRTGFAIVNRYGEFWSREIFDSPVAARAFFDKFWQSPGFENQRPTFESYKLVKAKQTLTYIGDQ